MNLGQTIARWPVLRQLREGDPLGLGRRRAGRSARGRWSRAPSRRSTSSSRSARTALSAAASSIYVKDGEVSHIEGDPASPISRGRLCPKGQASKSYVHSPLREYKVKYRRPYGTRWEELSLDEAMELIAQRMIDTRSENWQEETRTATPPTARWRSATSAARRSTTKRTT